MKVIPGKLFSVIEHGNLVYNGCKVSDGIPDILEIGSPRTDKVLTFHRYLKYTDDNVIHILEFLRNSNWSGTLSVDQIEMVVAYRSPRLSGGKPAIEAILIFEKEN